MCDSIKNFCIQEYLHDSEDPESSSVEGNDYDKEFEDDIVSKQDILSLPMRIIIYMSALLVGYTD